MLSFRKHSRTILWLALALCSASVLAACGEGTQVAQTASPGPTASATPAATRSVITTPVVSPIPSSTATEAALPWEMEYKAWLATRPRDMESYGLHYEPQAQPTLPPHSSVNMPIWLYGMPLQVLEGEPEFSARPTPDLVFSSYANLTLFHCREGDSLDIYCRIGSELLDTGCEYLYRLNGVYADLGPVKGLIARCSYPPPAEEEPREAYFYRTGCAFRNDVAYLFYLDRELRIVRTQDELKALFVPINSPLEALSYAQLVTGLVAEYRLQPEPEYLYFYDPVDATRVELRGDGYHVFLFHYQTCFCEPWINSEVEVLVTEVGDITWLGARPWSMTIGFSCAD